MRRFQRARTGLLSLLLVAMGLTLPGCGQTESQPAGQSSEVRADWAPPPAEVQVPPKPRDGTRTGPVEYTKIGIIAMDAKPWDLEGNYNVKAK